MGRMDIDFNWDLRGDPSVGKHTDVPKPDKAAKIESTICAYVRYSDECADCDFVWCTVRGGAHKNPPDEPRRHITAEFKDVVMQQGKTHRTAHIVLMSDDKDDFDIDYAASTLFPERKDFWLVDAQAAP